MTFLDDAYLWLFYANIVNKQAKLELSMHYLCFRRKCLQCIRMNKSNFILLIVILIDITISAFFFVVYVFEKIIDFIILLTVIFELLLHHTFCDQCAWAHVLAHCTIIATNSAYNNNNNNLCENNYYKQFTCCTMVVSIKYTTTVCVLDCLFYFIVLGFFWIYLFLTSSNAQKKWM